MSFDEMKAIGLSFVFGAMLTCLVWLIVRNPWAGLFGSAVCLGRFLFDNCRFQYLMKLGSEEITLLQAEVAMLRNMLSKTQAKLDRRQRKSTRVPVTDPSCAETQT